ncbi:hypothetical protein AVEN_11341-1 [Araneus ventricosus]|uniref:Uncharacterized protein n=1 Tax=Araneus ventricosus TaxID=182803 RepID=A0A4Y2U7G6_ARAVE|nr:hypothetical protein AVEN_11341-1 [Araneus ventricosus]
MHLLRKASRYCEKLLYQPTKSFEQYFRNNSLLPTENGSSVEVWMWQRLGYRPLHLTTVQNFKIRPQIAFVYCLTARRKTLSRDASNSRVEERRDTNIKSTATFGNLSALPLGE